MERHYDTGGDKTVRTSCVYEPSDVAYFCIIEVRNDLPDRCQKVRYALDPEVTMGLCESRIWPDGPLLREQLPCRIESHCLVNPRPRPVSGLPRELPGAGTD